MNRVVHSSKHFFKVSQLLLLHHSIYDKHIATKLNDEKVIFTSDDSLNTKNTMLPLQCIIVINTSL